jgi:uncharacterized membrane protein YbaN (DUF454 family)
MLRQTNFILWRIVAVLALVLGIIGLALPVIPTVPFLILAAFAGGKGWPALERWLLAHPTFGPHIRQWREHGAVPRRAKVIATLMMLVSGVGLQFTDLAQWLTITVALVMLCVAVWLWSRPEPHEAAR